MLEERCNMNAVDFTNSIEKVCEYGGSEKRKRLFIMGKFIYLNS